MDFKRVSHIMCTVKYLSTTEKKFIQKNNSELLTIVIAISKANNGNSDNDNNKKI